MVGRNGQGKSTLLKLVAQVMLPDEGTVDVHGGVAPLIEITGGFVDDLTVRDNVYLTAGLHGMSNARDRRSASTRSSSSPSSQDFIDTPYKHLSSGMKVRHRVRRHLAARGADHPRRRGARGRRQGVPREVLHAASRSCSPGGRTLFFVSHNERDLRGSARAASTSTRARWCSTPRSTRCSTATTPIIRCESAGTVDAWLPPRSRRTTRASQRSIDKVLSVQRPVVLAHIRGDPPAAAGCRARGGHPHPRAPLPRRGDHRRRRGRGERRDPRGRHRHRRSRSPASRRSGSSRRARCSRSRSPRSTASRSTTRSGRGRSSWR